MAVGIERIAAYPCTLALDMRVLAEARDHDPNHPIGELWVRARSLNPPWEDPVTMAVNAALQVVTPEDRENIELVIVGSESATDFGKPMSTYVQRWCQITPNCRNFETKHACYGGTSGLMMAAHWVASGAAPGKKALVVTSDQSRMHLGQPWEYVLGAAATAMLVSATPDVLELELDKTGYWTHEIFDTYRPTSMQEVGHADTSLYGYLEALEGAYEHFIRKVGPIDYDSYFARHIYHVPFGGMTFRAHRAMLRHWRADMGVKAAREHFERKSKSALIYNSQFGGSYTSATFIALMGLIDSSPELQPGDRVSMFSYGSGSCAEFYAAKIGAHAHARVAAAALQAGLDARLQLSVPEYEAVERLRMSLVDQPDYSVAKTGLHDLYERVYAGKGRLVLDGVTAFQRAYRLS
ncbi:MAG: hydroxymethylglutaryl-CoA synthase family protein [Nannocystis sp.]|uniref:hydroxymethylglutaryl-CoA synthase family protein n=1 Tax=Nannocystis sp. TaxID=1962667 RepID=UPI002420F208|nr:hydroxymethylglutaryl-CoA synthase [Nannocystis sp.]MBK9755338.1 hydroxymethylglutaryl-CoA synthase family protein [Nannocystis sp.]